MVTSQSTPAPTVVVVQELRVWFDAYRGRATRRKIGDVKAVDGVSLEIGKGRTFGLVGESGCGKTTLGLALLRLVQPTAGRVWIDGVEITGLARRELREARRSMQVIFQDPYASLNPRRTIGQVVEEPLVAHRVGSKKDRKDKVAHFLDLVGLNPRLSSRYPHELSGGQRQRVAIARALILEPAFVVCDEPTSALDVSIQAQIVNLLMELQQSFSLSYLFISHDIALVRHVSDTVGVMHLGRIVEVTSPEDLVSAPRHPYTQALISAVPSPDLKDEWGRTRIILHGDPPDPADPPSGCSFRTRCPYAFDPCDHITPALRESPGGHWVACHLPGSEQTTHSHGLERLSS